MAMISVAPNVPVEPLFAEGRILAGFLNEQSASTYQEFLRAPAADQQRARAKFGSATISGRAIRTPKFRHIHERDVIAVVAQIAAQCGGPVSLNNLVGFEWVEISGIIAGRLVASPMSQAGRCPTSHTPLLEVAQYCVIGPRVNEQDLNLVGMPAEVLVVSPEKLRLHPFLHPNPGPQGGLVIEYRVLRQPSPISLLYVDERLIALNHQERLVSMMQAGIKEALCLIHYGYGTEVLGLLSNIDKTALTSDELPTIDDFLDLNITTTITVSKPRTLITLMQHTTDLTVID